jgi:hypothetical protein
VITADNIEKPILEFLKHQPPVTVLQRLEAGAFTPSPGLIMLAGQRAFLGWPEHEETLADSAPTSKCGMPGRQFLPGRVA